jgi:penicillin-insensitive murein DD-endopeptidase
MVGDLSQPRGGPAPGGHSSHQTGLDVDLWFWMPDAAGKRTLTRDERESIQARSVLDGGKTKGIRAQWSARVLTMLHKTADDGRVERIFVNPVIKRDACKSETGDRTWLRKWYGHDDHFHVRLECPDGATDCTRQTPTPRGDGCAELDWWFGPEANEDRKKGQATYQAKVGKAPGMPAECTALLAQSGKGAPPRAAAKPQPAAQRDASKAGNEAEPLQASEAGASL